MSEKDSVMEIKTELARFLSDQKRQHEEFLHHELPVTIEKYFDKGLVSIGIDPEKKVEFQTSMVWLRNAMRREDEVKSTARKNITTWFIRGLLILAVSGFFYMYDQRQKQVALRNEQQIEILLKQMEKGEK